MQPSSHCYAANPTRTYRTMRSSVFVVGFLLLEHCLGFVVRGNSLRKSFVGIPRIPPTLSMVVGKTGGTVIQSAEEYNQLVLESQNEERPTLVFWTAPWCGPCRLSIPVVKDIVKQFSGKIEIVEVCTDDLPEVAADAGVVSIPTIQIWYKSELRDTIIGCVAKSVLARAVEKSLEDIASSRSQKKDINGSQ